MRKKGSCREIIRAFVSIGLLLIFAGLYSACATLAAEVPETAAMEDMDTMTEAARLTAPSPQVLIYNGEAQKFYFSYTGEEVPELIYYPSPEARAMYQRGTTAAPVEAGIYYVLLRLPHEEVFGEFRILKRPVKINAVEIQEARYNGDPKRVQASAEPDVSLSYFYYPSPEFREEAMRTNRENISTGNYRQPQTEFRGYRRVDRAPIEQGTYYVWICFFGDDNNESASAKVQFTILPPRGR